MSRKEVADFAVKAVEQLSGDTFIIRLHSEKELLQVLPGQFAEVTVPGSPDVFLRRPFSVHEADNDNRELGFYVKVIGKGTQRLAELLPGERVSVIYPLGKGFTILDSGRVLLIGGGTGVAPMLMLARHLKDAGAEPVMIIGGRKESDVHISEEYHKAAEMHVTTEDGSKGVKGIVTDHPLLKDSFSFDMVYTCGPEAMMKAVAAIARDKGTPCEVSLENTMACGFGACLCCVVKTTEGHKCVCTEGPVFNTTVLENW